MRSRRTRIVSDVARRREGRRSGLIILELILVLPILVILLLAIIEFGVIYQVNKQVAYASRFGAKLAAEIPRSQLSTYNDSMTLNNLKDRIDEYLANHGLTASCAVILEHNACSAANPVQINPSPIPSGCNCGAPAMSLPGGEPPAGEAYVRVTVGVKLQGNAPNCLSSFGFDLGDRTLEHSTLMRIEANNETPVATFTASAAAPLPGDYAVIVRSLPTTCPPETPNLVIRGTAPAGGTVSLSFDGSASSDAEGPVTYAWSTTSTGPATSPTAGAAATFGPVSFTTPPDPNTGGATTEPDSVYQYTVKLTVTDTCGQTHTCTLYIDLQTADSDPAP